ncbi:type I-E CRISPR-associated protein Cas7/Cse4/CasC [Pseudactinotalea sp. Z1732]|uniref:type I-E CRISPR-associated protein Cas7/Cse4/CasC n=1 Tax=Pseudactinotalea sp. Z1732 TaxID=3413026 RepID=UPI003C7B12FB
MTYIDVHILQSVPPSCVNRDDTGSPKTARYGGVRRARVSSQAWKRATRTQFVQDLDERDLGVRTKRVVEMVARRIESARADLDIEASTALATAAVEAAGLKLEKSRRADREETEFLVLVSWQQAATLAQLALDALGETDDDVEQAIKAVTKGKRAAKQALGQGSSIDLALFGRMVANDTDLNVDASCQVAHAISVHAADTEYDYFTAVDDLKEREGEQEEAADAGAGMIGTVEFTSATLYRYASINLRDLSENLGDQLMARRAVEAFISAFVRSMPTGKVNTFANHTLPEAVVVSVRDDQPVSYVGAFETPVTPGQHGGYVHEAAEALRNWARSITDSYGMGPARSWAVGVGPVAEYLDGLGEPTNFADLPQAVGAVVDERLTVAS